MPFGYICRTQRYKMPELNEISEQLKRITDSSLFSRSPVNTSLLSLLVNATIEGTKLKEASIGSAIFGKSYDPVKNDTKVRVYIHNLRKKLAEYYVGEGHNDPIIFEIEKGQYSVHFIPAAPKSGISGTRKKQWLLFGLASIATICLYFTLIHKQKPSPVWQSVLDNKFPISVLIGDHFMIDGPIPLNGPGLIRAFSINSESDFAQYIRQHPESASQLSPNPYTYVTKMGPYCTKTLGDFFQQYHLPFQLKLNSEWDRSKISEENIIYVGQYKTMGFLLNIFRENNPRFRISGGTVEVIGANNRDTTRFYSATGKETTDYTLVSKIKGPNRNTILLFVSDNDIGVINVLNYFTNADSLACFNKKNHIEDFPFTALFKVSGWERTGYQMKLERIEVQNSGQ
jgi:hypothetical protein